MKIRKISSKHQEAKRRRRNQIVVGLILVFLMLFSILGYGFQGGTGNSSDETETNNYNGFEFVKQNDFWTLNKDGQNFVFRNHPNDIRNIELIINDLENYNNKTLYIYSEEVIAESEIRTNLFSFVKGIENSCLEGELCKNNYSAKTCENNFIIIKEGEPKIQQQQNCVFISGNKNDLVELTDEFLFNILEIK